MKIGWEDLINSIEKHMMWIVNDIKILVSLFSLYLIDFSISFQRAQKCYRNGQIVMKFKNQFHLQKFLFEQAVTIRTAAIIRWPRPPQAQVLLNTGSKILLLNCRSLFYFLAKNLHRKHWTSLCYLMPKKRKPISHREFLLRNGIGKTCVWENYMLVYECEQNLGKKNFWNLILSFWDTT